MQAWADGVFTTLKVADGLPHHLGLHLARLVESAEIVGLDLPDADAVRTEVERLLAAPESAAALPLGRLRVSWDGTLVTAAVEPLAPHPPTTTALTAPVRRDPADVTAGAKTEALSIQGRSLVAWAREHGAGDALLATTDGLVCEGATSNVFYVVDGELRTPTTATGLLNGISRRLLIAATGAREVDAAYDVLRSAEEVFLTSSLRGVQAVTAIDGHRIGGPGPVTRAAQQAWDALPVDD